MDLNYNIQTIRDTLSNNIATATEEELVKSLLIIQNEIGYYLIQYSLFENTFNRIKSNTQRIYSMIGASEEISLNYSIFKQLNVYTSGINELIKDGYQIIHRIREWITGRAIKFQLGTSYYGKLYQSEFSLEEILEKAKVGYSSKNILSLRLHMSKSTVVEKAKSLEDVLQETIKEGTSVYSHIFRYFYHTRAGKNPNSGNVYEVYRAVIARRSWPNPNKIPPQIAESQSAYLENLFNIIKSNTAASYTGGDTVHVFGNSIIQEQDKFISSDPSLISIASIKNVLTTFYNSLLNFSEGNGNFYNQIVSLFTKKDSQNNISTTLQQIALDQTKKQLFNNISKLDLVLHKYF